MDQGLLTKEQERELRMYVSRPNRIGELRTQQEILQDVSKMLGTPGEAEA